VTYWPGGMRFFWSSLILGRPNSFMHRVYERDASLDGRRSPVAPLRHGATVHGLFTERTIPTAEPPGFPPDRVRQPARFAQRTIPILGVLAAPFA
jgi:hypothetical protein